MQQAVAVEVRPHGVLPGSQRQRPPARIDLPFGRTARDPVLEAVDGHGQFAVAIRHDQEARDPRLPEFGETLGVGGPPQEFDVHIANGTDRLLRVCYSVVTLRESVCAASVTARESRRPGLRPRRSIGPLTLMAAATPPTWSWTGALTLATPGSRSPLLS